MPGLENCRRHNGHQVGGLTCDLAAAPPRHIHIFISVALGSDFGNKSKVSVCIKFALRQLDCWGCWHRQCQPRTESRIEPASCEFGCERRHAYSENGRLLCWQRQRPVYVHSLVSQDSNSTQTLCYTILHSGFCMLSDAFPSCRSPRLYYTTSLCSSILKLGLPSTGMSGL
ncbi:hypothetical protein KQX54_007858 [Cotesia glomerata]|uniref:Uncharacterized protein n=1 Tax=Cotesia glomerata TaxID=32391 RepID=A0AAV7J678_COTGL|nr:hypothetical protein KQX54_007858 [Cotesia glomerata]